MAEQDTSVPESPNAPGVVGSFVPHSDAGSGLRGSKCRDQGKREKSDEKQTASGQQVLCLNWSVSQSLLMQMMGLRACVRLV